MTQHIFHSIRVCLNKRLNLKDGRPNPDWQVRKWRMESDTALLERFTPL